ncbi:MAG: hypothetical protein K6T66_05225 [Peptococcaceae bacterium]|nr:hypothetical protein [Peptococcaceae bacterium]
MPRDKKGNLGRLGPRERKAYRYLIGLLVAPAVFFVLYWLYAGGKGDAEGERVSPPGIFHQAGDPVMAGDRTLLAAPGGRVMRTAELNLGANRVIAESGYTFTVIPLVVPEDSGDPSTPHWYLVDGEGRKYNLLKVLPANPVEGGGPVPEAGPEKRLVYLVFKVNNQSGDTFLVYASEKGRWAWKIPRPGGPP